MEFTPFLLACCRCSLGDCPHILTRTHVRKMESAFILAQDDVVEAYGERPKFSKVRRHGVPYLPARPGHGTLRHPARVLGSTYGTRAGGRLLAAAARPGAARAGCCWAASGPCATGCYGRRLSQRLAVPKRRLPLVTGRQLCLEQQAAGRCVRGGGSSGRQLPRLASSRQAGRQHRQPRPATMALNLKPRFLSTKRVWTSSFHNSRCKASVPPCWL